MTDTDHAVELAEEAAFSRNPNCWPSIPGRIVDTLRAEYELLPIGTTARLTALEKALDDADGIICNAHRGRVDDVTTEDGASPGWAEAARRWIDAYPSFAALDAAASTETATQLDRAVRQREAVPGDPSQGPYPASADEVADEVLAWLREMDQTAARGLAYAVLVKLGDVFKQDPHEPAEIDAMRHMYNG
jgi:hypothetical protein